MSEIIDDRLERIFSVAAAECEEYSTTELLSFMTGRPAFPASYDLSNDGNYQTAYDLTLISFALQRRKDLESYQTPPSRICFEKTTERARESIYTAFDMHENRVEKNYFLSRLENTRIYEHMILSLIYPQYYGPEAAPKNFRVGAEIISDFWGYLLSGEGDHVLWYRWADSGDKDRFDVESRQAAAASVIDKSYSPKQIKSFKENLKNHLLKTSITSVSMSYHPDMALREAGAQSDIWVNTLTFPIDTTTVYDPECMYYLVEAPSVYDLGKFDVTQNPACIRIYNGRRSTPKVIVIDPISHRPFPLKPRNVSDPLRLN